MINVRSKERDNGSREKINDEGPSSTTKRAVTPISATSSVLFDESASPDDCTRDDDDVGETSSVVATIPQNLDNTATVKEQITVAPITPPSSSSTITSSVTVQNDINDYTTATIFRNPNDRQDETTTAIATTSSTKTTTNSINSTGIIREGDNNNIVMEPPTNYYISQYTSTTSSKNLRSDRNDNFSTTKATTPQIFGARSGFEQQQQQQQQVEEQRNGNQKLKKRIVNLQNAIKSMEKIDLYQKGRNLVEQYQYQVQIETLKEDIEYMKNKHEKLNETLFELHVQRLDLIRLQEEEDEDGDDQQQEEQEHREGKEHQQHQHQQQHDHRQGKEHNQNQISNNSNNSSDSESDDDDDNNDGDDE